MYAKYKHNIMTNMATGEELKRIREKYKAVRRADHLQVVEYDVDTGDLVKIYATRKEVLNGSKINEINLDYLLDSLVFYRAKSFTRRRFFVLRRNLPYEIPNHINIPETNQFTIQQILKTN